jgi:hypothetical protein
MRLHRIALDTLAGSRVLWLAGVAAPRFFPGRLLHQAALRAAWEGAFPQAERLFEAAARRYQVELDLVPLARLRVHQAMAHARASSREGRDNERCLDVERRLCRLERIEAPWPPFPLVDAPSLLASWLDDEPALLSAAGASAEADGHALDRAA